MAEDETPFFSVYPIITERGVSEDGIPTSGGQFYAQYIIKLQPQSRGDVLIKFEPDAAPKNEFKVHLICAGDLISWCFKSASSNRCAPSS